MEETKLLAQYWSFVQKFRSRKGLSMGDVRAYLSALIDLYVLEHGAKNSSELLLALNEALSRAKGTDIKKDYEKVLEVWRGTDKTQLSSYLKNITGAKEKIWDKKPKNGFYAVSLFTGSYGLDLGFEYAGFQVKVGLDVDPSSNSIIEANRPNTPFIQEDIKNVTTSEILETAGLKVGETDVLTGGPPCQPFSPAGNRKSLKDPRASPLMEYIRVIREASPKVFIMEEVPGLLSARVDHVPIAERGKRELLPDEERGSAWQVVLSELSKTGYKIITHEPLNSADYGAPQIRNRLIIMGVRPDLGIEPSLPNPTHKRPGQASLIPVLPWKPLFEVLMGQEVGKYMRLSQKYDEIMGNIPPGGNWRQLPENMKKEALKNAYYAGGGKMGFYRRLTWLEPSPTLVTSPAMRATMLVHPWEDRPLSINEYKLIQGFPIDWEVPGPLSSQYKKVGEAVPVYLSYAIAKHVLTILEG